MATTVNARWSSGSTSDRHLASCVGVAGDGLPSAFYYVGGNITVRQNEDGTIDVNQTSLTLHQYGISDANTSGGWGSDTWTFHGLYASKTRFTLTDGPGGPSGYGSGVIVWNAGHISHEGYGSPSGNPSSHYSYLDGNVTSTGWKKLANNVNELEHSSDYKKIYIYLGGLIDYVATPTTSISISSVRVELSATGNPDFSALFDYYPWERYIEDDFYSLNRKGGPSAQREVGLFRLENNKWEPVSNDTYSDLSKQNGQRYKDGWKKSPKSGKGAV